MVFVQLDKAIEQFLHNSYNKDEDYELLTELAMLADPDNESQLSLMAEEFAKADYEYNMRLSEEKGEERGEARLNSLYTWLFSNNRMNDMKKAFSDPEYRAKLFREYENA